jgi:hypothetical protein
MQYLAMRWFVFVTVLGTPMLCLWKMAGAPFPWIAAFIPWAILVVVSAAYVAWLARTETNPFR